MGQEPRLTTTSYAILGWLAVRPWSTYELARQMSANLNLFWPRAASRLYEEPKNLVAQGLATRERTFTGRRPRTMYAITESGREALRAWQDRPSAPPSLEFETLVHLYFAETATPEQMLVAIETARRQADAILAEGRPVGEAYLSGQYPFMERVQFSGFIYDFLWSFGELLRDWAERSAAEVATWHDTASDERKRERAFAVIRDCLEREDRYNERAGQLPSAG